jgi:hypothetical protein
MRKLKEGDTLSFYSRRTFEMHPFVTRILTVNTSSFELILEDEIPTFIERFDLMLNENGFADSVTIIGSEFCNNRARGALLKTSNVAVINTSFNSTSGGAIQAFPSCAWFCEGHLIRGNWTVQNSIFVDNNYSDAGPAISIGAEVPIWLDGLPTIHGEQLLTGTQHDDITIRNNFFDLGCNDQATFVGHGIDGLFFQDNKGCASFNTCENCRNVNQTSLLPIETTGAPKGLRLIRPLHSPASTAAAAASFPLSWIVIAFLHRIK